MKKFKFPSIFTFRRSLDVTHGFMYQAQDPNDPNAKVKPLLVKQTGFLGAYSGAKDVTKIQEHEKEGRNASHKPHVCDAAFLDPGYHYLVTTFYLSPKPFAIKPFVTVDQQASQTAERFIKAYNEAGGFSVLAKAYLTNLLSGRWFFRNDAGMKQVTIEAWDMDQTVKIVAASKRWDYSFEGLDIMEGDVEALIAMFARSMVDPDYMLELKVSGHVKLMEGREIFPSQAYGEERPKVNKQEYGRIYQTVALDSGEMQGLLTTQKIGNALRTIDTWWGGDHALPADPFGPDRECQVSRRIENNFYNLVETNIENWADTLASENRLDAIENEGDMHFVVACLVRGGVYNKK